jgi:hypothetical protein
LGPNQGLLSDLLPQLQQPIYEDKYSCLMFLHFFS